MEHMTENRSLTTRLRSTSAGNLHSIPSERKSQTLTHSLTLTHTHTHTQPVSTRSRPTAGPRTTLTDIVEKGKRQRNPFTGPEDSRRLRLPDFRQSSYEGGKVVSSTHRPPLSPSALKKYSWYSFRLKAESTPGPHCGRRDYVNEKFQWHWESNPRPSGS
jgi:hypothetical protein